MNINTTRIVIDTAEFKIGKNISLLIRYESNDSLSKYEQNWNFTELCIITISNTGVGVELIALKDCDVNSKKSIK